MLKGKKKKLKMLKAGKSKENVCTIHMYEKMYWDSKKKRDVYAYDFGYFDLLILTMTVQCTHEN